MSTSLEWAKGPYPGTRLSSYQLRGAPDAICEGRHWHLARTFEEHVRGAASLIQGTYFKCILITTSFLSRSARSSLLSCSRCEDNNKSGKERNHLKAYLPYDPLEHPWIDFQARVFHRGCRRRIGGPSEAKWTRRSNHPYKLTVLYIIWIPSTSLKSQNIKSTRLRVITYSPRCYPRCTVHVNVTDSEEIGRRRTYRKYTPSLNLSMGPRFWLECTRILKE